MRPEVYVYAEYGWTCQVCYMTVKGYDTKQDAKTDGDAHNCEEQVL